MRSLLIAAALFAAPADPISILDQTDGVTSKRMTTVALYCRKDPCSGSVRIGSDTFKFGSAAFAIPAKTTGKVPVRISKTAFETLKDAPRRKLKVTLTVKLASGQT